MIDLESIGSLCFGAVLGSIAAARTFRIEGWRTAWLIRLSLWLLAPVGGALATAIWMSDAGWARAAVGLSIGASATTLIDLAARRRSAFKAMQRGRGTSHVQQ